MSTFLDLKKAVGYFASQARDDTTDTIGGFSFEDYIDQAINVSIGRMQRDHLWSDLWTYDNSLATVASTKILDISALSANFIQSVILVNSTSSNQLKFISRDDVDAFYPYPEGDSENQPLYCIRRGTNTVEFNPIPDAIYTLWFYYYKYADELTADGDTPDISNVDDVIEAGAMVEICYAKTLIDDAAMWEIKYQSRLREGIKRDIKRPEYTASPRAFGGGVAVPGDYHARPDYGWSFR